MNTKALRVTVETEALERVRTRLMKDGIDAANEQVSEEIERQRRFAYDQWGVDTGLGRESLQVLDTREGEAFAVRIFSDDDRVPYQSWNGKRPTFWDVLIRRPIRKLTKKLAKIAAKALAEEANGG